MFGQDKFHKAAEAIERNIKEYIKKNENDMRELAETFSEQVAFLKRVLEAFAAADFWTETLGSVDLFPQFVGGHIYNVFAVSTSLGLMFHFTCVLQSLCNCLPCPCPFNAPHYYSKQPCQV